MDKIPRKVLARVWKFLEIDDPSSQFQEGGRVVHEVPGAGVDESRDQRIVAETQLWVVDNVLHQ